MLDYLGANQGFMDDAEKVFELAARRKDIKLVSSSAITDILYVLRRAVKDRELVRRKYESLRKKISILSVTEQDIDNAFARDWKDFEDAVQYTVAESNGVDCIITRNKDDFEEDKIPCCTPQEFLAKF
ncbi:MAG: PIN domain-containing protein [Synergistaceae bacterium]|nr:PIN domain-containing protein [Synergistaceae bacterium]